MKRQRVSLSDFVPRGRAREVTRDAVIVTAAAAAVLIGAYFAGAIMMLAVGGIAWRRTKRRR